MVLFKFCILFYHADLFSDPSHSSAYGLWSRQAGSDSCVHGPQFLSLSSQRLPLGAFREEREVGDLIEEVNILILFFIFLSFCENFSVSVVQFVLIMLPGFCRSKRKFASNDDDFSATCQAMEGVQVANGLECKIACSSSKVHYTQSLEYAFDTINDTIGLAI